MSKKVFITGITGFAGSFLSEYLLTKGYTVAGVVRPHTQENKQLKNVTYFEADLLDSSSTAAIISEYKPDFVYHLAALSSPAESFQHPASTLTNNITAEVNVLEALRKNNLLQTKVLVVSSGEIYGAVASQDLPVNEQVSLKPMSPYGVSKITQDFLGLQYFLSYKMPIVRVRPFNHIGPRQTAHFVVAAFAKQIAEIEKGKKEAVLKVGNLEAKRDFTDVRDIVRAYELVLTKGKAGEVYNIGSGKSYKIADILEGLLQLSKVTITIEKDQKLLRPSDIPEIVCDNTKIQQETGWKPEITLDESLKDVLDYWRNIV